MFSSWKSWLAKLKSAQAPGPSRRARTRRNGYHRPSIETLEDRITPTNLVLTAAGPAISEKGAPSTFATGAMAVGPDHHIWFTETGAGKIGTINPTTGAVTEFPITSPYQPQLITAGPNGNIWYVETHFVPMPPGPPMVTVLIGEMTPSGQIVSDTQLSYSGQIDAITVGPDNNLWFTETDANKIGTFNTSTHTAGELATATHSFANGITVGPDGNIWFGEGGDLGKIDPNTQAITYYPLNSGSDMATAITAGPDGNLWFGEYKGFGTDKIGRMNLTTHAVDEFLLSATGIQIQGITAGPDGNLWFTESLVNQFDPGQSIAAMSTSGQLRYETPTPTADSQPQAIVKGPDGNLWFTEGNAGKVGKVVPPAAPPLSVINTSQLYSLGSFSDPNAGATSWTAEVDWGDGTHEFLDPPSGPGPIVTAQGNPYPHTYHKGGNFTVTVTVTDDQHFTGSTTFPVSVTAPPPTLTDRTATTTIKPGQTALLSYAIHDPDAVGDAAGRRKIHVTITWGDGSDLFQQDYSGKFGNYLVNVTHPYYSNGAYKATINVTAGDFATGDQVTTIGSTKFSVKSGLIGNGLISFASDAGSGYDVYTGAIGSNQAVNLTHAPSASVTNGEGAWSPDGTQLAFTSNRDDTSLTQLYVMQANGVNATRLTSDAANDFDPVWSPDGKFIAFVSDRSGHNELWVMNAATGDTATNSAVELTTLGGSVGVPTWWGDEIAFQYQEAGSKEQIYAIRVLETANAVKLNSATPQHLTPAAAGGNNFQPAFSPDGSQIAFTSDRYGNDQIFVMDTTGGNVAPLTNDRNSDSAPAWSPDGKQIVFMSTPNLTESGNHSIYTMAATGGARTLVSFNTAQDNIGPSWQPVQRPVNDDFASATPFGPTATPSSSGYLLSSNVGASKRTTGFLSAEASEPNHALNMGGQSIWFVWTSAVEGDLTVSTSGSQFTTPGSNNATLLEIYTAAAGNTKLTPVADYLGAVAQTVGGGTVRVHVGAGIKYYIAVDGDNDGSGAASGIVRLNWLFNQSAPTPIVTSISPDNVLIDPSNTSIAYYTFAIHGSNFTPSSVIEFSRPTGLTTDTTPQALGTKTYISPSEIDWSIPALYAGIAEQYIVGLGLMQRNVKIDVFTPNGSTSGGVRSSAAYILVKVPGAHLDSISPASLDATDIGFASTPHSILLEGNFTAGAHLYVAYGTSGAYQQRPDAELTFNPLLPTVMTWTANGTDLQHTLIRMFVGSTPPANTEPGIPLNVTIPADPAVQAAQDLEALKRSFAQASGKFSLLADEPSLAITSADLSDAVNGASIVSQNVATIVRRDIADLVGPHGAVAVLRLDQEGATFYGVNGFADNLQATVEDLDTMIGSFGYASNTNGSSFLNLVSRANGALLGQVQRFKTSGTVFIHVSDTTGHDFGFVEHKAGTVVAIVTALDKATPLSAAQVAAALGANAAPVLGTVQTDLAGNLKLFSSIGKDLTSIISHDGGTLIATGGGNVVSNDGGSLVATGGGNVVSNDGGSFIGTVGGNIISHDGGTFNQIVLKIISHDGGTFTAQTKLINPDGASLINSDGASLINPDGASFTLAKFQSLVPNLGSFGSLVLQNNIPQIVDARGFAIANLSKVVGSGAFLISAKKGGIVTENGAGILGTIDKNINFIPSDSLKLISEHGAG